MAFVRAAAEQQLVLARLQSFGDGGCLPKVREKGKNAYAVWKLLRGALHLREVLITFGSFVLLRVFFLKVNVPAEVELPV